MLAIRLPPAVEKRLARLAEKTGRTKTFYASRAIIEFIGDLEDVFLAEKRLEDFRAGRGRTIPLDELLDDFRKSKPRCRKKSDTR